MGVFVFLWLLLGIICLVWQVHLLQKCLNLFKEKQVVGNEGGKELERSKTQTEMNKGKEKELEVEKGSKRESENESEKIRKKEMNKNKFKEKKELEGRNQKKIDRKKQGFNPDDSITKNHKAVEKPLQVSEELLGIRNESNELIEKIAILKQGSRITFNEENQLEVGHRNSHQHGNEDQKEFDEDVNMDLDEIDDDDIDEVIQKKRRKDRSSQNNHLDKREEEDDDNEEEEDDDEEEEGKEEGEGEEDWIDKISITRFSIPSNENSLFFNSNSSKLTHSKKKNMKKQARRIFFKILVYIFPIMFTVFLFQLLIIRFDMSPLPHCSTTYDPNSLNSLCGPNLWNPQDLVPIHSHSFFLTTRYQYQGVTSPFDRSTSSGIYGVFFLKDSQYSPPKLLWPSASDTDTTRDVIGDPKCTEPPNRYSFQPHSIASVLLPEENGNTNKENGSDKKKNKGNERYRIAVTASSQREAIELFDLTFHKEIPSLKWVGCIYFPPDVIGNSIFMVSEWSIFVTNQCPFLAGFGGLLSLHDAIEYFFGHTTGNIYQFSQTFGWSKIYNSETFFPSHVLYKQNHLYFVEQGKNRICKLPLPQHSAQHQGTCIQFNSTPESISFSSRSTLLVAVHQNLYDTIKCILLGKRFCKSSWDLYEVHPKSFKVPKLMYKHDGSVLGAVSSVVEMEECIFFGSQLSDRIGYYCPNDQTKKNRTLE